jgi:hypothetical protein
MSQEHLDAGMFASASDEEMMSLLGMYALPLVQDPTQTLIAGREGKFWQDGSTALGEEFQHRQFGEIGKLFLKKWAVELGNAVCGNDTLYRQVKEKGLTQLGVVVGIIGTTIGQAIPALAPYTALLAVLGAFIAQTGFQAFCKMLADLQAPSK